MEDFVKCNCLEVQLLVPASFFNARKHANAPLMLKIHSHLLLLLVAPHIFPLSLYLGQ